ncbi:MAG: protein kinaselike protein [Brevibacillus sp.]|nr:protein kinaselike protein [Brevibacillus sp.]
MRVPYQIDDSRLASILRKEYGIQVREILFIPWGTSAYSYKVNAANGECFYLKLFDLADKRQSMATKNLDWYLPLTWKLYQNGIFRNLTYPIKTKNDSYYAAFKKALLILFNYIEGKTWKESAYSKEALEKMAILLASLHKATPQIGKKPARLEQFHSGPKHDVKKMFQALESPRAFPTLHQEALRDLILPRKELITGFLNVFLDMHAAVPLIKKEWMLCHGDLWAGNIITSQDELFLIDWEHATLAPPERDLSYFVSLGKDFELFFRRYESHFGQEVVLHADLIRFYTYRRKLTHFVFLLKNVLYRNKTEEENRLDLETISNYYTFSWDHAESAIEKAKNLLQSNIV